MGKTKRIKQQTSAFTSDNFYTDPSALWPLLPYLDRKWKIWECACGDEKKPLLDWLGDFEGFSAMGTDIRGQGGTDFLTEDPSAPWDCIITNPPYSIKDQWIERCYDLGKPFALLMPFTAMEGRERQRLYKKYGLDLLVLPKRVVFTTPSGKKGGAWFPCAWFTWQILPERLIFV